MSASGEAGRQATVLLLGATAALAVTACSVGEGGWMPAQRHGETYAGDRRQIDGVLEIDSNQCYDLTVDGTTWFVIWPEGSRWDLGVRLPNGQLLRDNGTRVSATGARTPTAALTDEFWTRSFLLCAPGAAEVLVLDIALVAAE